MVVHVLEHRLITAIPTHPIRFVYQRNINDASTSQHTFVVLTSFTHLRHIDILKFSLVLVLIELLKIIKSNRVTWGTACIFYNRQFDAPTTPLYLQFLHLLHLCSTMTI